MILANIKQHTIFKAVAIFVLAAFALTCIPCIEEAHALGPWLGRVEVRRAMYNQALELDRIVYADPNDHMMDEAKAFFLSHGKILLSPDLKGNTPQKTLEKLRCIFHEEVEAVMQIIARQDRSKYSTMMNIVLSNSAVVNKYDIAFNNGAKSGLPDELLFNDIMARAFELLILWENKAISQSEMTGPELAFMQTIRPMIMQRKHNYFTGIFWDQYEREYNIRLAVANGQKFHQVASAENNSARKISTIKPKKFSRAEIFKNRSQIRKRVERPLVAACEELYDRNVQTLESTANREQLLDTHPDGNYYASLTLNYDTLSAANKTVVDAIVDNDKGRYKDMLITREYSDGFGCVVVGINIPITEESTDIEVHNKALEVARLFEKQRLLWAPTYTLSEIKELYGDTNPNSTMDSYMGLKAFYPDKKSGLFYLSEEICLKTKEALLIDDEGAAHSTTAHQDDGENDPAKEDVSPSGENQDKTAVDLKTTIKTITFPNFSPINFKGIIENAPSVRAYQENNKDKCFRFDNTTPVTYMFKDSGGVMVKEDPENEIKVIKHARVTSPSGKHEGDLLIYYNPKDRSITISMEGAHADDPVSLWNDRTRGEEGWDRANLKIFLNENFTFSSFKHVPSEMGLSRRGIAIIMEDAGIHSEFADLYHILNRTLVLPEANEVSRITEEMDNTIVPLSVIRDVNLHPKEVSQGSIMLLGNFTYYKSWAVREPALNALRKLYDNGMISREWLERNETAFEADHIKEDLLFIERVLLHRDSNKTEEVLFNFSGEKISREMIDSVDIKWFDKGMNKNVYTMTFFLKDGRKFDMAVSTIRDDPLGGGFPLKSIEDAQDKWSMLSERGSDLVPRIFGQRWLFDYRPRIADTSIRVMNAREDPEGIGKDKWIYNNLSIVFREFVDGPDLQTILEDGSIDEDTKKEMTRTAMQAALDIWNETKDETGRGFFIGDPKPANIVMVFEKGAYTGKAKVIDLDALRMYDDLEAVRSPLLHYPEYRDFDVIYENGRARVVDAANAPNNKNALAANTGEKKILIVYHSGSGGTKNVAEAYKEKLSEKYRVDMIEANTEFTGDLSEYEMVLFGFPTFALKPSPSILEFVDRLKRSERPIKAFAFCTKSTVSNNTLRKFGKHLLAKNIIIGGHAEFRAPGTDLALDFPPGLTRAFYVLWSYAFGYEKDIDRKIEGSVSAIDRIIDAPVAKLKMPRWKWNTLFWEPLQKYVFDDFPINVAPLRIIPDRCTKCNSCVVRFCPRGAWGAVAESVPEWAQEKCDRCMSCVHKCPAQAIVYDDKMKDNPRLDSKFHLLAKKKQLSKDKGQDPGYPKIISGLIVSDDTDLIAWNAPFVRNEALLTGEMAELIALHAGLPPPYQKFLRKAGFAHDIGKKGSVWYFNSSWHPSFAWFRKFMSLLHPELTIIMLKLKGITLLPWEEEVLRHHSYINGKNAPTSDISRRCNTILVLADQIVARHLPRKYKKHPLTEYDPQLVIAWVSGFFERSHGIEGSGAGVLPEEDKDLIALIENIDGSDEFLEIIEKSLKNSPETEVAKKEHPDDNVTCGTICESEHREGMDALNRQLASFYEGLAGEISTDANPVTTPLTSDQVIQALSARGYDQGMLEGIRGHIQEKIPDIKKKQIQVFFAIPPDGRKLWWVKDDYAGGHFGRKSIHISLPLILSRADPKDAALAIARHEYDHIARKGHTEEGLQIIKEAAKTDRGDSSRAEPDQDLSHEAKLRRDKENWEMGGMDHTAGLSNFEQYLSEVLALQESTFMKLMGTLSGGARISLKEANWLAALRICNAKELNPDFSSLDRKAMQRKTYLEFLIQGLEVHLKENPRSRNFSLTMIKTAERALKRQASDGAEGTSTPAVDSLKSSKGLKVEKFKKDDEASDEKHLSAGVSAVALAREEVTKQEEELGTNDEHRTPNTSFDKRTALENHIRATTGTDIVKIGIDGSFMVTRLSEILKSGNTAALDLSTLQDQRLSYEKVRERLSAVALTLASMYGHIYADEELPAASNIHAILRNSFAHGNKLDFDLPIYINAKRSADGTVVGLDFYDLASDKEADVGARKGAKAVALYGMHTDETFLKMLNYNRQQVLNDAGEILGTRTTLDSDRKKAPVRQSTSAPVEQVEVEVEVERQEAKSSANDKSRLSTEAEDAPALLAAGGMEKAQEVSFKMKLHGGANLTQCRKIANETPSVLFKYVRDLPVGKEFAVSETLAELSFNIMRHANGGIIKVYLEKDAAGRNTRLKIVSEDNGKGLPGDPNKLVAESLRNRDLKVRKKRGFSTIALVPDRVTIEFDHHRWERFTSDRDAAEWFRIERSAGSVSTGTRFTLEFDLENAGDTLQTQNEPASAELSPSGMAPKTSASPVPDMDRVYAVIVAGGEGKRLWPYSTAEKPKALCSSSPDGKSLVRKNVEMLKGFIPEERIFISIPENLADSFRAELPEIPNSNFIIEPVARGVYNAFAFTTTVLSDLREDSTVLTLLADTEVDDTEKYRTALARIISQAQAGPHLAMVGVKPRSAHTGYGYIECAEDTALTGGALTAKSFRENLSSDDAALYASQDNYYWNPTILAWDAKTMLETLLKFYPESHAAFMRIKGALGTPDEKMVTEENFERLPDDLEIWEKVAQDDQIKMVIVPGDFQWNDAGDWNSIATFARKDDNKNSRLGKGLISLEDSRECVVFGAEGQSVTVKGLTGYITVVTESAVLVLPKQSVHRVKELVNEISQDEQLRKYTLGNNAVPSTPAEMLTPTKPGQGNTVIGNAKLKDSKNCYISTNAGLVAAIDAEGISIIRKDNAVYVSGIDRTPDVSGTSPEAAFARFRRSIDKLSNKLDRDLDKTANRLNALCSSNNKTGQSIILYADDILDKVSAVDLERTIRNVTKEGGVLHEGKIIIYSREKEAHGAILEDMVRSSADISVEIISTNSEKLKARNFKIKKETEEVYSLIRFAKQKGVDPSNILGIIKGAAQDFDKNDPDALVETSKENEVPIVILSPQNAVYSFATALELAMLMKKEKGSIGWVLGLLPIQTISEDIKALYYEYKNSLQALIAA